MTLTLITSVSPEPGCLNCRVLGSSRLPWCPWSPRWTAYLDFVHLEIDGLGAHADIVGDDIQDEGVYSLRCVQGGRLWSRQRVLSATSFHATVEGATLLREKLQSPTYPLWCTNPAGPSSQSKPFLHTQFHSCQNAPVQSPSPQELWFIIIAQLHIGHLYVWSTVLGAWGRQNAWEYN